MMILIIFSRPTIKESMAIIPAIAMTVVCTYASMRKGIVFDIKIGKLVFRCITFWRRIAKPTGEGDLIDLANLDTISFIATEMDAVTREPIQ
jgi:hypothetical protein